MKSLGAYVGLLAGLLSVGLLMTGCASTSQSAAVPDLNAQIQNPDKARIYVLRKTQFWGEGDAILLSMTDKTAERRHIGYAAKSIGELGPGHYLCLENNPGVIVIRTVQANPDSEVVLNLVAGQTYYVRLAVGPGFNGASIALDTISEVDGKALLKHCKPPNR